jgi:hypothetical protein
MERNMMENGKIVKEKDTVFSSGQMGQDMRDNGDKINQMEKGN